MHDESTSVLGENGPYRLTEAAVATLHTPEKPLHVAEVAELLDVDPTTIYRAIKAGDLKALRIGRGRGTIRIPVEAFAEYQAGLYAAAVEDVAA
ncbi:excisionase family DNA binding protein [Catenulispora sp. MAP12-49]|uniref:helix-turn-helix domain-containing protein n=1 Tax=Catenulispora sp. MAP12-49 TaxID=3156302 RepID=UPI003515C54F